jgi:hypothetical protein
MPRNERATSIKEALRKKYPTPRDAARALNLDQKLLDVPRLALDGARKMPKNSALPTRFQFALITGAARALNPLLAKDAKVDYRPIFDGVTRANIKSRKATIIADAKKALKGKTIAKDATIEHLASMLDHFEHAPKSMDESVSGPQHRAMEAAAHGHSNLGIPAHVGKEFEQKDKGKHFDALPAFLKEKGVDDSVIEDAMKMLHDSMPENALDGNETDVEIDEGEDEMEQEEAEDGEVEQEEAEDGEIEQEEGEDHGKGAKDRHMGKDRRMARDSRRTRETIAPKTVTEDAMNKAIAAAVKTANKHAADAAEARAFVEPFVGKLPLSLDSAEKILRAAAENMGIEDAADVHPSALRTLIKTSARVASLETEGNGSMANDSATSIGDAFDLFPEAQRIRAA